MAEGYRPDGFDPEGYWPEGYWPQSGDVVVKPLANFTTRPIVRAFTMEARTIDFSVKNRAFNFSVR